MRFCLTVLVLALATGPLLACPPAVGFQQFGFQQTFAPMPVAFAAAPVASCGQAVAFGAPSVSFAGSGFQVGFGAVPLGGQFLLNTGAGNINFRAVNVGFGRGFGFGHGFGRGFGFRGRGVFIR